MSQVVEDEIRAIAGSVRMAGSNAVGTALETYEQGCGSWGERLLSPLPLRIMMRLRQVRILIASRLPFS